MKKKLAFILAFTLIISGMFINIQAIDTSAKVPFNMSIVTKEINEDGSVGELKTVFGEEEDFVIEFKVDPQEISYDDIITGRDKEVVIVVDTSGSMKDNIEVSSPVNKKAEYKLLTEIRNGKENVLGYIDSNNNVYSGVPSDITVLYDKTKWIEAYEKDGYYYCKDNKSSENINGKEKDKYFRANNKIHFNSAVGIYDKTQEHPGKPAGNYGNNSENNSAKKIEVTKNVLKTFISNLGEATNIKVSFVDFNNVAQVIEVDGQVFADLDDNQLSDEIENIINSLSANGGTNTGDGLRLAYYNLLNSGNSSAEKYIILLTDGEPTFYTEAPEWVKAHSTYVPGETKWIEGYYESNRKALDVLIYKENNNGNNNGNKNGKNTEYELGTILVYDKNGNLENSTFIEGRYDNITGRYENSDGNNGNHYGWNISKDNGNYYIKKNNGNHYGWPNIWQDGYYYLRNNQLKFEQGRFEEINGYYESIGGYSEWVDGYWSDRNYSYYYGDIELPGEYSSSDRNYEYYSTNDTYFRTPNNNDCYKGAEYVKNVATDLIANQSNNLDIVTHVIGFDIDSNNNKLVARKANNINSDTYYHVALNTVDISNIYSQIADKIVDELSLKYIDVNIELPEQFDVSKVNIVSDMENTNDELTIVDGTITGRITDFKYELNTETMKFEAEPILLQVVAHAKNNCEGEYVIGDENVVLDNDNLTTYIQYKDLDNTITYKAFSAIRLTIANADLPELLINLDLQQDNGGVLRVEFDDRADIEIFGEPTNQIFHKSYLDASDEPSYTIEETIDMDDFDDENNNISVKASVFRGSFIQTVSNLIFNKYDFEGLAPNEIDGYREVILEFEAEAGLLDLTDFKVKEKSQTGYLLNTDDKIYTVKVLLDDGENSITAKSKNSCGNTTNLTFKQIIDAKLPNIEYTLNNELYDLSFDEKVKELYLYLYDGDEIPANLTKVDLTEYISDDKMTANVPIDNSWSNYTAYFKADDMANNRGTKQLEGTMIVKSGLLGSFDDDQYDVVTTFDNTYGFMFKSTNPDNALSVYLDFSDEDLLINDISNFKLFRILENGKYKLIENITKVSNIENKDEYILETHEKINRNYTYLVSFDLIFNLQSGIKESSTVVKVGIGNIYDYINVNIVDLPILE